MIKIKFLSICIFLLNLNTWAQVTNDSLANKLLEEDTFREYVPMDTVWEGSNYSEYIYKGIIQFNTQKNINLWLDSLSSELGKEFINVKSIEFESLSFFKKIKTRLFRYKRIQFDSLSWKNSYEWRNKKYLGVNGIRLLMYINKEDNPKHYNVVMYFFDRNNDLIEDSTLLNMQKIRIKRIIFNQKVKTYNSNKSDKTITVGKSRYFSYWSDFFPINYDSVMKIISKENQMRYNLSEIKVKCIINKNGSIKSWQIDSNDELYSLENEDYFQKYQSSFRFPVIKIDSIDFYVAKFPFKDILKDSLRKETFLSNFEHLFDTAFVDTTETVIAKQGLKLGKYKNTRLLNWGNLIEIYSLENSKWQKVYNINLEENENQSLFWFSINDINKDGHEDLIVSTSPNMNGNTWKDLYLYIPQKDSFLLKETGINIREPYFEDSTLSVKKGYLIAEYGGSWYMPNTKTVYKWNNYHLETELILGTELLLRSMMQGDDPIYFVYKKVNGKLTLAKQHNLYGNGVLESHYQENELLAPYLEKKIIKK